MKIRITLEPPRVRTVLLQHLPRRLAFPYVIFIDESQPTDPVNLRRSHKVFVAPRMPTRGDDHLYQFPLAQHEFGNIGNLITGSSHIGKTGIVCYNSGVMHRRYKDCIPWPEVFWGTNFNQYDGYFVDAWIKLSENDPKAAFEYAIRGRPTEYTVRGFAKWGEPLALGENIVGFSYSDDNVPK